MLPPPQGGARGISRPSPPPPPSGRLGGDARGRRGACGRMRGKPTNEGTVGRRRSGPTTRTTTRSIKEPNGTSAMGGNSSSGSQTGATNGASGKSSGGGGWANFMNKASELTKKATAVTGTWATQTQNAVTSQVNEKVKLIQPSMNVAVDHFGPTARQINNLLKPVTEPIRKEWLNLKPETRRVLKGGFFGSIFGNVVLGWPARADRKRLLKKVEQMQMERTKMLVDDFSLEREVLALNAENRRLEKRTLRAEMALNAIKRRLSEYVVQPKDDQHFADPNLSTVMPGAPWANGLLDAIGDRVETNGSAATPTEPQATAINAIPTRTNKGGWSRTDEAWAHGLSIASEEASSDGGERPTSLSSRP